jgi:predicted ATPase
MHGLYSYREENPGEGREPFHEISHGEGFLQMLRTRVNQAGFYLMDEPDSPLSFTACLALAGLLHLASVHERARAYFRHLLAGDAQSGNS